MHSEKMQGGDASVASILPCHFRVHRA